MNQALKLVVGRGAALLLAVALAAYALVWLSAIWLQPALDLGFELDGETLEVLEVAPGSAAEDLGLKAFDTLVAIEGVEVASAVELHDAVRRLEAGDYLRITVRMAALERLSSFDIPLVERKHASAASWIETGANAAASGYPFLLLWIAIPVLLRRPDSAGAWLWCCGTLGVAVALWPPSFLDLPPLLRGPMFAFRAILGSLGPALLFAYFAGFPTVSPIADRYPRLQEAVIGTAVAGGLFAAIWSLVDPRVVLSVAGSRGATLITLWLVVGFALCVTALVWNLLRTSSEKDARVLEWMVAGATLGLSLPLLTLGWSVLGGQSMGTLPFWVRTPVLLTSLLFPAMLAHISLDDDPDELPDAARSVGRWLLAGPGGLVLWALLGAIVALPLAESVHASGGWLAAAAAFGIVFWAAWCWIGLRLRPVWSDRVDRRLFGEIHRRRSVLKSAGRAIDSAQDVGQITHILAERIRDAVRPSSLAIYLADGAQRLVVQYGDAGEGMERIPLDEPLPEESRAPRSETVGEMREVVDVGPDCLIPIRGESAGLQGLIALGPHGADSRYSTEERRLLLDAASRAAAAIDRLAVPADAKPWTRPEQDPPRVPNPSPED